MTGNALFPSWLVPVFWVAFIPAVAFAGEELDEIVLNHKPRTGMLDIAFSSNGKFIAGCGSKRTSNGKRGVVYIWRVNTQELVFDWERFPRNCASVEFSPNGNLLAVACGDRAIYLFRKQLNRQRQPQWSPLTRLLTTRPDQIDINGPLQFSPDGSLLVTSIPHPQFIRRGMTWNVPWLHVWNTEDWSQPETSIKDLAGSICSMEFLDKRRLVTGESTSPDPTIQIYDLESGDKTISTTIDSPHDDIRIDVDVSPTKDLVAAAGTLDHVFLYDQETLEMKKQFRPKKEIESSTTVTGLDFSPNGRWLAFAADHYVEIWNVSSGESVWSAPQEMVYDISFSPDGRRLAIAGQHPQAVQLLPVKNLVKSKEGE